MQLRRFAAPLIAAVALTAFAGGAAGAQPHVKRNAFTTKLASACRALPSFPTAADTAKTLHALERTAPALQKELNALRRFYNTHMPQPPGSIKNDAYALNTDVGTFIAIFGREVVAVRHGNLHQLAKLRKQVAAIAPRMKTEFKAVGVPGCL